MTATTGGMVHMSPAPYPTNGGEASSWGCTDATEGDPPVVVGTTCTVTGWGADPAPTAEPAPTPSPTVTETVMAPGEVACTTSAPCSMTFEPDTMAALGMPLLALVILGAAAMVQRVRR